MRQALSRLVSSFRERVFRLPPNIESRLSLIRAVFGVTVFGWLMPLIAQAQFSSNGAVAAGEVKGAVGQFAQTLSSSPTIGAMADGASYIFNLFLTLLSTVLYLIIYALIFVNTLITDLLIRVAQYNNFVNATPVNMGWPLVRDVCNMFFIIVLLLIAFSTIIGYKEFHYKNNLPKLLLYAVLINFSKTLIGLLIDFSQVVTLTFVVGFKDAAFGNFAKAFQVPALLSLNANAAMGNGPGLATTSNIVVALLFGIWIMTIAMTALCIMLIYFIARIIGLWVLLIMSPLAFFVLGIPSKLGSKIAGAGEFWGQLSAWLTGGPIVAFFLWLALAVIQGSPSPFADVGGVGRNAQEEAAVQAVVTEIGKPENILNFIVSVAFMLYGVKTAVEVSSKANGFLGGMAKQMNSGGGVAFQAIRNAPRAARAIAGAPRAARNAAGSALSYVTPKSVMEAVNKKAGDKTAFGRTINALGAGSLSSAMLNAQGKRDSEEKKIKAKELESDTEGLGNAAKIRRLDALKSSKKGDLEGNLAQEQLAKIITSKGGEAAYGKMYEASLSGGTPAERKIKTDIEVKRKKAEELRAAETIAKENEDDKLKDFVDEERKKDPGLYSYQDLSSKGVDPQTTKAAAWGDSAVFIQFLKSKGLIDEATGGMAAGYKESKDWQAISRGSGNAAKLARLHEDHLSTADGKLQAQTILAGLSDRATDTDRQNADKARYIARVDDDGFISTGMWKGAATGRMASGDVSGEARKVTDFNDLTSRLTATERTTVERAFGGNEASRNKLAGNFTNSLNSDQARVVAAAGGAIAAGASGSAYSAADIQQMAAVQAEGLPLSPMKAYDEKGAASAEGERAIAAIITQAFAHGASANSNDNIEGARILAGIDQKMLRQGGTAAQRVVSSLSFNINQPGGVDAFKQAYSAGNKEMQAKIESRIRDIIQAADGARGKAAGSRSRYESDALAFQDQLLSSTDDAMRKLGGRGKKKGGTP